MNLLKLFSRLILVLVLFWLTIGLASAQSDGEQKHQSSPHSRDEQIRIILSAVPEHLRKNVTVYLKEEKVGYVKVRAGTNGFYCLELGSHHAPAPHCYDEEGAQTIMKGVLRYAELRAQGKSADEANKIVGEEYKLGKLLAPRKPGIVYMMSDENMLGGSWYPPHLMYYSPYMKNTEIGASAEAANSRRLPWILGQNNPDGYIIAVPSRPDRTILNKTLNANFFSAEKQNSKSLPLMSEEKEVELALSAGPENIRQEATVYILKRGGFVKVREGKNNFSCLVWRGITREFLPICYDPEGTQTILKTKLRQAELIEQGKKDKEIRQIINAEYKTGKLTISRKMGVAYLLSNENYLLNPKTKKVSWFPPLFMNYSPYLKDKDIGTFPEHRGSLWQPWIINEGEPDACIVTIPPEIGERR